MKYTGKVGRGLIQSKLGSTAILEGRATLKQAPSLVVYHVIGFDDQEKASPTAESTELSSEHNIMRKGGPSGPFVVNAHVI